MDKTCKLGADPSEEDETRGRGGSIWFGSNFLGFEFLCFKKIESILY